MLTSMALCSRRMHHFDLIVQFDVHTEVSVSAVWSCRGAQHEHLRQQRSRHAYCTTLKSQFLSQRLSGPRAQRQSHRPDKHADCKPVLEMNAR